MNTTLYSLHHHVTLLDWGREGPEGRRVLLSLVQSLYGHGGHGSTPNGLYGSLHKPRPHLLSHPLHHRLSVPESTVRTLLRVSSSVKDRTGNLRRKRNGVTDPNVTRRKPRQGTRWRSPSEHLTHDIGQRDPRSLAPGTKMIHKGPESKNGEVTLIVCTQILLLIHGTFHE